MNSRLQERVAPWMLECFGAEAAADIRERCDRFIEEAFELVQSFGYDRTRLATLEAYVYGRPVGKPAQEVGGVMLTLAALCGAAGLDMHAAGDDEIARVSAPEMIEKIRAKQASKRGLHTPLPVPPEMVVQGSYTSFVHDDARRAAATQPDSPPERPSASTIPTEGGGG